MPRVAIAEHPVATVEGPGTAWVVSPLEHIVVGRERLAAFRAGEHRGAAVDREILELVRGLESDHQLVVVRARDDSGRGSWRFDPTLDDEEARELGYHLVLDQLPTYRRLVAAGVFALLHVEYGPTEVDAYQYGTRTALEELESNSIPEEERLDAGAIAQVDRWILHNLAFFFTLSLEDVEQTTLERQLPLLRERVPHLRRLCEALPASALA